MQTGYSSNLMKALVRTTAAPLGGSLGEQNLRLRGRPPLTICARLDKPVNTLQLCSLKFSHKETLQQTFFQEKCTFRRKTVTFHTRAPFGGLAGSRQQNIHLRLIVNLLVDYSTSYESLLKRFSLVLSFHHSSRV